MYFSSNGHHYTLNGIMYFVERFKSFTLYTMYTHVASSKGPIKGDKCAIIWQIYLIFLLACDDAFINEVCISDYRVTCYYTTVNKL